MKLIITIPNGKYRYIQELEQGNTDYATTRMLYHAVKHGKPYLEQPKTGHWIKTIGENGITSAVRCSECGFEDNRYMFFRYCPNCGCRMVDTQESENEE